MKKIILDEMHGGLNKGDQAEMQLSPKVTMCFRNR